MLQISFRLLDTPTIAHSDVGPLIGHSHGLPRLIGTCAHLFTIRLWQLKNRFGSPPTCRYE